MSTVYITETTGSDASETEKQADIFVDNIHIELSLWDTAGQEEFDRLRSLSYDDTHAIMLCFSVRPPRFPPLLNSPTDKTNKTNPTSARNQVDSKDSLENVESKWVGEIAENCQGVKLVRSVWSGCREQ